MVLDTSGEYARGDDLADLTEYVRDFEAGGYRVDRIVESVCAGCDGREFGVDADDDEGLARRTCLSCGATAFLGDSADHWDEDGEWAECTCPCGGERFAVAVGFSVRDDGDIRWVSVGLRCLADGVLGVYVDWKIDYSPALDLPA
ncbi:hypothetical protein ACWDOP_33515 [Nocardia sp. NPDC003693]